MPITHLISTAVIGDSDDPVDVIGHYGERIRLDIGELALQGIPGVFNDSPCR